jgi:hypothetical protein
MPRTFRSGETKPAFFKSTSLVSPALFHLAGPQNLNPSSHKLFAPSAHWRETLGQIVTFLA